MSEFANRLNRSLTGPIAVMSPRWQGVLTWAQIAKLRAQQIPVAFDPVQIGWVETDRYTGAAKPCQRIPPAPLSWRMPHVTRSPEANALAFRPWQPSDLVAFRALLNDPQVWEYMFEDWPGDISDSMALDLITIATSAPHHTVSAVLRDGVPVGQVRLAFEELGAYPHKAEISYWLGRAHWGQGLGKTLVATATQQAFDTHASLRGIVAHVHPDNPASARVLAHAGYQQIGTRRDGWLIFQTSR
ncbi:MAG: GNAT family N-acetyltransferase [Rhodobacterales bacterium]